MILLSGHKAEREAAAAAIRRSKWGQHGENLDGVPMRTRGAGTLPAV